MTETRQCLLCGDDFTQGKPPKAVQVFCSWACHQANTRAGNAPIRVTSAEGSPVAVETRMALAVKAKLRLNLYAEGVGKLSEYKIAAKALKDFIANNPTSEGRP